MLSSSDIIAFVATRDPARARDFYENTLGLRLVSEDAYALVFDGNGTMLRVQQVDDLSPAPFTVLGWRVSRIADTVRELAARGVRFDHHDFMAPGDVIWWSGAGHIAWFKDPDGNTLSLTEFA